MVTAAQVMMQHIRLANTHINARASRWLRIPIYKAIKVFETHLNKLFPLAQMDQDSCCRCVIRKLYRII